VGNQGVDAPPAMVQPSQEQTPPQEDKDLEVELGGQFSYLSPPVRGGVNPFGAGFGGHLGLAFRGGLYLGISAVDFLGGKDVDLSYRSLLVGVDVGWALPFAISGSTSLTLRPQLGVGDAAIYFTDPTQVDVVTSASGGSSSSDTTVVNNVYLRPGLTAMLSGGGHFVALDAGVLVVPGIAYGGADPTTWVSYGAQAQLGFRF
jgi:hypothetical protein